MYRVGFLLGATRESVASLFHALQDRLRELGYIEGRNVVFVQRYADALGLTFPQALLATADEVID
jgi:hypothetical protein